MCFNLQHQVSAAREWESGTQQRTHLSPPSRAMDPNLVVVFSIMARDGWLVDSCIPTLSRALYSAEDLWKHLPPDDLFVRLAFQCQENSMARCMFYLQCGARPAQATVCVYRNGNPVHVTACHLAAENPEGASLVFELCSWQADPNARDSQGFTPLMCASKEGNEDVVGTLLQIGADPNVLSAAGESALSLALERGHAGVVRNLASHPKFTALVIRGGQRNCALLFCCSQVTLPYPTREACLRELLPCARVNRAARVQLLHSLCSHSDTIDPQGKLVDAVLTITVIGPNEGVMLAPDINGAPYNSYPPIFVAALVKPNKNIVLGLLRSGVHLNQTRVDGLLLMDFFKPDKGDPEIMSILCRAGALTSTQAALHSIIRGYGKEGAYPPY